MSYTGKCYSSDACHSRRLEQLHFHKLILEDLMSLGIEEAQPQRGCGAVGISGKLRMYCAHRPEEPLIVRPELPTTQRFLERSVDVVMAKSTVGPLVIPIANSPSIGESPVLEWLSYSSDCTDLLTGHEHITLYKHANSCPAESIPIPLSP
jgi:hypothetical protein